LCLIRNHQHVLRYHQWKWHPIAITFLIALFWSTGCRRAGKPTPETEFLQVNELFLRGNLDAAQAKADQAITEQSRPEWAARFRVEDAKIRLYQGKSEEAIQLLNHGWVPSLADPNLTIQRLTILSLAFASQGSRDRATQAFADAEDLCKRKGTAVKPSVRAELLGAQGRFEAREEHVPEARTLFQKSLTEARVGGDRFFEASALLNLGVIDLQQLHYEDALEQLSAAASVAKAIQAQLILEKALGNAGWAYYGMGDYQRSLPNFDNAVASAASLGSTIDEEFWNHTAGMSEARLGDFVASQRHYERALALARSMKNTSEIEHVEQTLASLLLHTAHPETAKPYIDEAQHLAQQMGDASDIQEGKLLEAQLSVRQGDSLQSGTHLLEVERQTSRFPTVRLEAQHTLAQVYDRAGDYKDAEIWFRRSIATYRMQRSELKSDEARLPFSQNGHDLYMDYVAYLVRNHRTDEALDVIDQGRAETLAEGLGFEKDGTSTRPLRISLRTLARESHAVILVYAMSAQASYLWAANGKESGFYTLPDRATILTAVASHRRAVLAARDLVAEQHPAARDLYEMLVKPAEHLIHHGDRVFIVAGGLNGLNFETLLTPGQSSHYWIEDVAITHLASVRLLALTRRQHPELDSAPHPGQLLVIGNPVYSGEQYTALPNAAAEVADVAAHFPDHARTVLTGMNASPDAYIRSDPARFEYIHFVSHATASRLVPLDSAVVLSAHGTPDSAKLYARDILSKPLHAELVTISACQGSGVREYGGEGLVGLAWAFLRAGSHNVIGALWDVSDASTPELMGRLYDGIAAGNPPDVALRAAKLAMLHSRGVFRKPIYWGAFQLYSSGE
jgi:CHAT domain-containing protein